MPLRVKCSQVIPLWTTLEEINFRSCPVVTLLMVLFHQNWFWSFQKLFVTEWILLFNWKIIQILLIKLAILAQNHCYFRIFIWTLFIYLCIYFAGKSKFEESAERWVVKWRWNCSLKKISWSKFFSFIAGKKKEKNPQIPALLCEAHLFSLFSSTFLAVLQYNHSLSP